MARIKTRSAARADLEHIWRSSVERFGEAVAEAVLRRIDLAFSHLARFPGMGRARDDLAHGVRTHLVRGYPFVIFYRQIAGGVEIIRVLYAGRDARRQMGPVED